MLLTQNLGTDLFAISVACLVIIIAYYKWSFKYWAKRGVVTPTPSVPFGNAGPLFMGPKNFGELFQGYYKQFKQQGLRYGGSYFFTMPFFIPTDLELVKCILQKDFQHFVNHGMYINEEADPLTGHLFLLEDIKWRNLRVKLTPTFTSGKMKMMFQTLADCAIGLKDVMKQSSDKQTPVDIKEILSCFSTDIISSCAFGIDCDSLKNPKNEFRTYGKMIFELSFVDFLKQMAQFTFPRSFLSRMNFVLTKPEVTSFFMDMVKRTVEYREKNNIYRKDFMHLLLQLKNRGKVTDDEKLTDKNFAEVGLSMNEVTAQAFVFFLAGFETSSTTMTFALYEIALNKEVQSKMREEIRTVLKKYDNKLTYDGVMELHYIDKVVNETLRKYPPVPMLNRVCNKDYKVPDSNLIIKKGTNVTIPTLGIHYDHEYYPNPVVFDPERFSEENKASRPSYTWLPFGEGPRICIGLRFGIMQSKVGLATLLHNYEITLNKKTEVPLTYDKVNFILVAKHGVWLNVKEIKE